MNDPWHVLGWILVAGSVVTVLAMLILGWLIAHERKRQHEKMAQKIRDAAERERERRHNGRPKP